MLPVYGELRTKPWVLDQVDFVKFQFFQKDLPLEQPMNILMAETDPVMSSLALDDITLWSSEVKDNGDQEVVFQGERASQMS